MKNPALVVVLLLAVSAVFYYLALGAGGNFKSGEPEIQYLYPPRNMTVVSPKPAPAECIDKIKSVCVTDDGCEGEMLCSGGKWSGCSTKRVCRPGRVAPCPFDSCNFGLRTCNECGDSWSSCTYPGR